MSTPDISVPFGIQTCDANADDMIRGRLLPSPFALSESVELEPAVEGFAPGAAGVAGIVRAEGACAVVIQVHLGVSSCPFPVKVQGDNSGGNVVMVTTCSDKEFWGVLGYFYVNQ